MNSTHNKYARHLHRLSVLGITLGIGMSNVGNVATADEVLVQQRATAAPSVEPEAATAAELSNELRAELQAIARPKREALLRFPVIGQISQIHVTEGVQVTTGTPLVTLDDSVQSAQVKAARVAAESMAGINQAEIVVQRSKKALERVKHAQTLAASALFEVEAKQADYDQAVAQLVQQQETQRTRQAELQLALANQAQHTLSAPFDGQVVLIAGKLGNTVEPAMVAVQIADLSVLEVELHLPCNLFGKIKAGETMSLIAGTPVNRIVHASVGFVSPVIEPTGGTFMVRAEIDNHDSKLPAGFEVWLKPVQ